MAKMKLDFTESQRQIAPEGIYSLRCKDKTIKLSKNQKPMVEIYWIPFNPPDGVSMDQIDKCTLKAWISLAPNALFSLANLMAATNQEKECVNCGNKYSAKLEVCDRCSSAVFEFDPDFIDSAEPQAFITIKKDQNNENDVNEVTTYIVPK